MNNINRFICVLSMFFISFVYASNETIVEKIEKDYIVEEIRFIDDSTKVLDDPLLLASTTLKKGAVLNTEDLYNDLETLTNLYGAKYLEVNVRVDPGQSEDGVIITYVFQRELKIGLVSIQKSKNVEAIEGIRNNFVVQKGESLKHSNIQKDLSYIAKIYQDNGYPDIEVDYKVEEDVNDAKVTNLIYVINSRTNKQHIKEIRFKGNTSFGQNKLLSQIRSKKSTVFKRQVLNLRTISEDVVIVENYYKDNGFLDVKIKFEICNIDSSNSIVDFFVEEGKRYVVDDIQVVGASFLSVSETLKITKLSKGSYLSQKLLRTGLQNLRKYLGEKSFILAKVTSDFDVKTGTLHIFIDEGMQQEVDEIIIEGNSTIEDKLILENVYIFIKQKVKASEIEKTLKKLNDSGYFESVKIDYKPHSNSVGNIVISVKESQSYYLEFGFGQFEGGFGGDISYKDPNVFNSGTAISFSVSKDDEMDKLSLVLHDPHLFGSDYEMTSSISVDNSKLENYEREKLQLKIMLKKLITNNLKLGLGTRFEFMSISNVNKELQNEVHDLRRTNHIIGLVSTLVYKDERIDHMGNIIEGKRLSVTLMPSYNGVDYYNKMYSEFVGHYDLGKNKNDSHHVVSGRITLGLTSGETPFYEKFYAGGMSTLRGYASKSIAPVGKISGGSYLFSANTSYSFPIWSDVIKGVLFIESASVANDFKELARVRSVAGFGIRANLKETILNGNVEAGMAFALNKKKGDILKPFYFTIGNYNPAYDL